MDVIKEEFVKEIESNIDRLHKKNLLAGKEILSFGSFDVADVIRKCVKKRGYRFKALLNNDESLRTPDILNEIEFPVFSPSGFFASKSGDYVVLIASRYYREMVRELGAYGFSENKNVFRVADQYYTRGTQDCGLRDFFGTLRHVFEGYLIKKKLEKKHGLSAKDKIFLCGYPAIGDTYMICGFIRQYAALNNINKWLLVVQRPSYRQICSMFGIENVEVMDMPEIYKLMHYCQFRGTSSNIEKICTSTNRLNDVSNFFCYKGINFMDIYKKSIFDMPDDTKIETPQMSGDSNYLNYLVENGLIKKDSTIVLFPYAYTTPNMPARFWKITAEKLAAGGCTVATSIAGGQEKAIEGTAAYEMPLGDIPLIIQYAGGAIMNRSGICELVSSVKCKKVVIYPKYKFRYGTSFEAFSLKAMGIDDHAAEIDLNPAGYRESLPDEVAGRFIGI